MKGNLAVWDLSLKPASSEIAIGQDVVCNDLKTFLLYFADMLKHKNPREILLHRPSVPDVQHCIFVWHK